jgi:hypothetical protein
MVEHVVGGPAYFAVQAEHRNAVHRVAEVRRLDHVVLLVATQSMLGTESRGDVETPDGAQRVERMFEIRGHGSGMREQRNAPAFELALQFQVAQQAVDSELDHERSLIQLNHKAVCVMEIGFLRGMFECPV